MRARLFSSCLRRSGAVTLRAASVRESTKPETRRPFLIWKRASPWRNSWPNVGLFSDPPVISPSMMICRIMAGDCGAGIARSERDLIGGHRPAAGRHDLAIALDRLLQRGDGGLAQQRDVDAVSGA